MFILELKAVCCAGAASFPDGCQPGLGRVPGRRRPKFPLTPHHHAPWLSESCPCRPVLSGGGGGGGGLFPQPGVASAQSSKEHRVLLSHCPLHPHNRTMNLARVTVLSALAGQDLVPEQALQVQEADEAGRGGSGGQRAGQWPGPVCRLPASAAWLEPQLLIRKGLR